MKTKMPEWEKDNIYNALRKLDERITKIEDKLKRCWD